MTTVKVKGRTGIWEVVKDDDRTVLVRQGSLYTWVSRTRLTLIQRYGTISPVPAYFWLGAEGEQR